MPSAVTTRFFPEVVAGGFSRVDTTVAFYARVNALVSSRSVVVDFGAGRGRFMEDPVLYKRGLQRLKGRVEKVIGLDVDDAVLENDTVDESYVVSDAEPWPVATGSVDLVVSDWTFEHVAEPTWLAAEMSRILKPGGWICARTPNKYGYVSVFARLVPNTLHERILRIVQPERKSIDIFPTLYRLNTRRDLRRHFPEQHFEHAIFEHDAAPLYAGNSALGWRVCLLLTRILPRRFYTTLFVFLRKKGA